MCLVDLEGFAWFKRGEGWKDTNVCVCVCLILSWWLWSRCGWCRFTLLSSCTGGGSYPCGGCSPWSPVMSSSEPPAGLCPAGRPGDALINIHLSGDRRAIRSLSNVSPGWCTSGSCSFTSWAMPLASWATWPLCSPCLASTSFSGESWTPRPPPRTGKPAGNRWSFQNKTHDNTNPRSNPNDV